VVCKENEGAHCVLDDGCSSRQVLGLVADKWAILVVYALAKGTRRYNRLQREIGGVSQKMLTQTLRGLECNGLVEREVYASVPPKVEYSLTALGRSLVEALRPLCEWSERNFDAVEEARSSFRASLAEAQEASTS
jgi:DNA-binding HxlR family transcriptional regulator